jgi:hypothetical protein
MSDDKKKWFGAGAAILLFVIVFFFLSRKGASNASVGSTPGIASTPVTGDTTVTPESLMNFALPTFSGNVNNANGNIAVMPQSLDSLFPIALYNVPPIQPVGFGAPGMDDGECPCDPCKSTPGLLKAGNIGGTGFISGNG